MISFSLFLQPWIEKPSEINTFVFIIFFLLGIEAYDMRSNYLSKQYGEICQSKYIQSPSIYQFNCALDMRRLKRQNQWSQTCTANLPNKNNKLKFVHNKNSLCKIYRKNFFLVNEFFPEYSIINYDRMSLVQQTEPITIVFFVYEWMTSIVPFYTLM